MGHLFRLQDQVVEAALAGRPDARMLLLGDEVYRIKLTEKAGGVDDMQVDEAVFNLVIAGHERLFFIHLAGEVYEVAVLDPLEAHARAAERHDALAAAAPMPGTIVALPVAIGDAVEAGDVVVIIESMKLEMSLRAGSAAIVTQLPYEVGTNFEKGAILVQLATTLAD
jgi:3-methylcrotonyl-CoA carboxylase alpha subunit